VYGSLPGKHITCQQMQSKITIPYSDKLPDVMQVSREQFEKEARLAMAIKLFEMKRLSSGMAASLAGIDRVSFLLKLSEYNVNMLDYEADELESDFENA
jgi:predicted HTH domain antitoxin